VALELLFPAMTVDLPQQSKKLSRRFLLLYVIWKVIDPAAEKFSLSSIAPAASNQNL